MKYNAIGKRSLQFLKRPLFAALVLMSPFTPMMPVVFADTATAHFTWDMSIEHTRQQFEDTDGNYTRVSVIPGVEWGEGWQLRLELPWQTTQGETVVARASPQQVSICEWVQSHPRRVQQWLAQGKITQAQLDRCNDLDGGVASTEADGLADSILWFNRFIPLTERWAVLPQLGYKSDSGDANTGLGTGTEDAIAEVGLYADFAPISLYALLGHERVLRQSSLGDLDDFSYTTLELDYALSAQWVVGTGIHRETTQVDYLDDMQSVSAQLNWRFLKNYSARLLLQRYNEESGFPEQEAAVSLSASF